MNSRRRIWWIVNTYAVFACLWSYATLPIESVILSLTHDRDIATIATILAVWQSIRMFIESIAGYRMLKHPPAEQAAYLEIMRQRIC